MRPTPRWNPNQLRKLDRARRILLDQDDGKAARRNRSSAPKHRIHHLRHQTKRELVDQKEPGLDHERATHRQHLLLTAGQ